MSLRKQKDLTDLRGTSGPSSYPSNHHKGPQVGFIEGKQGENTLN